MEPAKVPCRYCKHLVERRVKRCPYCHTMNPTARVKEVLIWTVAMIVVLYIATMIFGR